MTRNNVSPGKLTMLELEAFSWQIYRKSLPRQHAIFAFVTGVLHEESLSGLVHSKSHAASGPARTSSHPFIPANMVETTPSHCHTANNPRPGQPRATKTYQLIRSTYVHTNHVRAEDRIHTDYSHQTTSRRPQDPRLQHHPFSYLSPK